jgi:hypothetical protein
VPDSTFIEGTNCECDVTLDTWLRDALPFLPGIVRAVAERELILAAREFFERSCAWQVCISEQHAKEGPKQYWLSPYDQYSNVVRVMGVAFNGTFLHPLPHKPLRRETSGTPYAFWASSTPDAVELHPELAEEFAGALDFYVALTPKQSVEHLPRVAAIKYYDAILEGFLARTLRHPNKPYSSPTAAVEHRRNFMSQIGRYAGEAKQGYLGVQNWRYPTGWTVRRPQK